MNKKIYQKIGIILCILILINPIISTEISQENQEENIQLNQIAETQDNNANQEVETISSNIETVNEETQEETLSTLSSEEIEKEQSLQEGLIKEDILVNIDEIECKQITQEENNKSKIIKENLSKIKEDILVPIENINLTIKENITKIELNQKEIINITNNITNTSNQNFNPNKEQAASYIKEENQQNNITIENVTTIPETKEKLDKQEPKKIWTTLSKNQKIELEGEIPEDFDINSIEKKESKVNDKVKEVIIKSGEHLEDPITVYADIPEFEKDQISQIEIYWVNEEKIVEITGFYDSNENGLYDRLSWVVPHLSEQIFEIRINPLSEEGNSSSEIMIYRKIPTPQNGETINTNYVEFNFSINYTNVPLVKCELEITGPNNFFKEITTTSSWETNQTGLPDGSYSWHLLCFDTANTEINKTETGNFIISENYYVETPKKLYVLDWNNNLKNNPDTSITINSYQSTIKEVTIYRDSTEINKTNITTNEFELKNLITEAGNYTIKVKFYRLNQPYEVAYSFTVAKTTLAANKLELDVGESVEVTINVNSPESVSFIGINFGDGTTNFNTNSNSKTFSHVYDNEGIYTVTTDIQFGSAPGETYTFSKEGLSVTNPGDTKEPTVNLIDPDDDETINSTEIDFSYSVDDNIKVKNCTFELYIYENGIGVLEASQVTENPEHNTRIKLPYEDFEEGEYSWNVYCCDNSSNCNSELKYDRDFTVGFETDLNSNKNNDNGINFPEKEDLKEVIEYLDNFIELKDSLNPEEKEALIDLGIDENLTYYKKRLTQIEQDFENNLKFVSSEELKESKRTELTKEYQEIKKNIPTDFEILDQEEYTKNSYTKNFEDLIKEYTEAKKIPIEEKSINKLTTLNQEIQKYISILTNVKKIKIEYIEENKEMVLITKKLTIKNESFETIIEYLPDSIKNPFFLTKANKLTNNIYEIPIDELEEDKIIYFINDNANAQESKEADTLLFKNFVIKESKITGLFFISDSFNNSLLTYLIFIVLLIIVIYLGYYASSKAKMAKWKKEEDVNRILSLIKKSKVALQKNDLETPKESYHKIKELYPLVAKEFRNYSYKEIKKIRVGIDRREIISLVKEYEKAKAQERINDSKKIYENVKATYKRLPKKDQEKIYNKMFKNEWEI